MGIFAAGRAVLYKAQELDFRLTMDYRRMGGVVWTIICVCGGGVGFLKWFEESCEQQVGETSSSSLSLSFCPCENLLLWKERTSEWCQCHQCVYWVFWVYGRKALIRDCKIKSVIIKMPFIDQFFAFPKLKPIPDGHCSTKSVFLWYQIKILTNIMSIIARIKVKW